MNTDSYGGTKEVRGEASAGNRANELFDRALELASSEERAALKIMQLRLERAQQPV